MYPSGSLHEENCVNVNRFITYLDVILVVRIVNCTVAYLLSSIELLEFSYLFLL